METTDKATAIREARAQLRARGEVDSMNRVVALIRCSKRTARKYWPETTPVDAAPPEASAPVPGPHGSTVPVAPTEAAFRASFHAYVEAGMRWLATQGLMGNEALTLQLSRRGPHLPTRKTEYALPRGHPLVEELEDDLAEAYVAHLDVWKQRREQQAPAPAPGQFEEPAPEPPPPPAYDLANLRAYYLDRSHSPWPEGTTPPLEAYGLLTQLAQEYDDMRMAAHRQRYVVMNAQGTQAPAMRQVEDTMNAASVMFHRVKSDMNILEMRAHDHGVPLPT